MTYAPADLLTVQRYAREKTGQNLASLGIIHGSPQGGGYHEGQDLLVNAGRAPGPQYPDGDYSYEDAPQRDLAAPHDMSRRDAKLAGGDAASAFDLGGGFDRFLQFNAWMRARLLANDPRTADIREMIYTLDGRTVRRIDRTGAQRDGGDDSHLSHTHFSFFRDSLGRRDRDDNFLGLLREFFDGKPTPTPEVPDVNADQDRKLTNVDQYLYEMTQGSLTIGYIKFPDGTVRTVPNVPMQKLAALQAKVGQLEVGGVDLDALAAKVAALLPTPPTAAEVAQELASRLGNG